LPSPTHSPAGRGGTFALCFSDFGWWRPSPGGGGWEMGEGSGVRTPRDAAPASLACRVSSVQPDLVVSVVRRGLRKDHDVAGLQTALDLHGVDRRHSEFHRNPYGRLAVLHHLEHLDLLVRRAEAR